MQNDAMHDGRSGADRGSIRAGSGWQVAWAVLLVIAGALAVAMPGAAALATAVTFGWLLVLAGAFETAWAVHIRGHRGFGWVLFSGLLTVLLGIAVLVFPLAGVLSLALLVGAFLFGSGVAKAIAAVRMRARRGWGWLLADGIASIVVSVLIAIGWPGTSFVLIGVLTGVALLAAGLSRLMLRGRGPREAQSSLAQPRNADSRERSAASSR